MGTSNWQNISWCVQAIMRIEPERVLDIGVGYGRWGMTLREFGEVWFGRVTPDSWTMHIEGIEGFAQNVAPYHESFYDQIHVGDANEVLFDLEGHWNLAILGDVLEHFVKSDGERILDYLLDHSDYVLINLPLGDDWPQEEMYDNPYEEHKAVWNWSDFENRPVLRRAEFLDFDARPFGSVVLSRKDPRRLADGLFGSELQGELRDGTGATGSGSPGQLDSASGRERLDALEAVRSSGAWATLNRLRNNPLLWRARGLLGRKRGRRVSVEHAGSGGEGEELRLLRIESDASPVLWDFVARSGQWSAVSRTDGAFGESLASTVPGSRLRLFDYSGSLQLVFEAHPGGTECLIRVGRERHSVDLSSERSCVVRFDCKTGLLRSAGGGAEQSTQAPAAGAPRLLAEPVAAIQLSADERALVDRLRQRDAAALAVYSPGWTGIEHSTRSLFGELYSLAAQPSREERERFLTVVEQAECANIVLSGGALEHLHLAREIQQRAPDSRLKLLWHGSFLQVREDYAWRGLRLAIQQARQGLLHSIGFVKAGMAEALNDLGLRASFVENFIADIPETASKPADGGPHVGCWVANEGWRKPPYAMAVATRRIDGAILHQAAKSQRLAEFCRLIELKLHTHGDGPLSQQELLRWLRLMHLNMYVTLSECAPMLPLESLSVGTPCLIGANSHLFQDHDYLREMLVVPMADSSDSILQCAKRALGERDAIIDAYRSYAPDYNARARASVEAFLAS